jgi:hypothetical protein
VRKVNLVFVFVLLILSLYFVFVICLLSSWAVKKVSRSLSSGSNMWERSTREPDF